MDAPYLAVLPHPRGRRLDRRRARRTGAAPVEIDPSTAGNHAGRLTTGRTLLREQDAATPIGAARPFAGGRAAPMSPAGTGPGTGSADSSVRCRPEGVEGPHDRLLLVAEVLLQPGGQPLQVEPEPRRIGTAGLVRVDQRPQLVLQPGDHLVLGPEPVQQWPQGRVPLRQHRERALVLTGVVLLERIAELQAAL